MKRKRVLLLLCILNCTLQLFAQQINVQGVVYDLPEKRFRVLMSV